MRHLDRCSAVVVWVAISLLSGCNRGGRNLPTGTVSGTVTLAGKPLSEGSIVFFGEAVGDTAMGVLQSDGTYALKYENGFSVPAGDYRVAIVMGPPPGAPAPDPMDLMKTVKPPVAPKSPIPAKYRDPNTSTLVAVVKEGANPGTNFDLK